MANTDAPSGFKPVMHRNGAPYNGSAEPMEIPAGYNSGGMFVGDIVVKVAAGSNLVAYDVPGYGSFDIGMLPTIELAAVTDTTFCSGVIVGFAANPDNLSQQYNPTSTARIALVCTDPDILFEAQHEGTTTGTMVGLNATFIKTHSGSTVTGLSGQEIDTGTSTSPAADSSLMLRLVRPVNRADNAAIGLNSKWLCTINMHSDLSTGDGDGALGI